MHPYAALARKAVEAFVLSRVVLSGPEDVSGDVAGELAGSMDRRAGVFVCLKRHGELRGCIGTFLPTTENVCNEIVKNAIAAATEDPRFPPVQRRELDSLEYSVDILTEPERVSGLSQLDPGRYGVIVVKGARKGLLLPDLEGVDTVEEQLRIAKMKAGIAPSDDDVELFRFAVERYK
ncbi:MAG: AmmeMemoRadiSam system protein A [Nitrospirota bacterium]